MGHLSCLWCTKTDLHICRASLRRRRPAVGRNQDTDRLTSTPRRLDQESVESHEHEGTITVSLQHGQRDKWPSRLRLFGQAVLSRSLRQRPSITLCDKCHGYHHGRNCARSPRCINCSLPRHDGAPCPQNARCINCLGLHPADYPSCPARPTRRSGTLVRRSRDELNAIRSTQSKLRKDTAASSETAVSPLQREERMIDG